MSEEKPNCYQCKHRGDVPGSAHSCCEHPATNEENTAGNRVFAILASVGRCNPVIAQKAADELGIHANFHGIRKGWFNWPFNFDPVWLEACKGFEQKP